MKVTATMPMVKRCPFVNEVDVGTVTLEWDGDAPELHAVAEHVRRFAVAAVSHEAATRELAAEWNAHVVTTWTTAGLAVTVEHSPADPS